MSLSFLSARGRGEGDHCPSPRIVGARERWYNRLPRRSPMTPKTYNDEFKAAAAKLVSEQGYSVSKAAESLGVDPSSIRRWVREFAAPAVALPDASAEEPRRDNLRLREENRRLLMEREVLKRATAFFARERP